MDTKTSKMEVRKEVRFAVVMYGGVSLAIYIPGQQAFGHTIDALAVRNSGVPVDRKLVYIDPSPELSAQWAQDGHAINPVENVAAAFSLARYETIRLTPSRRYGSLTVVRVHQYKISLSKVARCANGGRYPAAGVCGGAYLRAYISRVDLRSIGVWT